MMKVKQLIDHLKYYNPDLEVVLECEHGGATAHRLLAVRVSNVGHVTLRPSADYIDNYYGEDEDEDEEDE